MSEAAAKEVIERYAPLIDSCWGKNLRPMEARDVKEVCQIHTRMFPDYFLTSLGKGVLACYYRCLIQFEHGYAVVYQEQSAVKGFFTGLFAPDDFYRFLLRRSGVRLTLAVLPAARRLSVVSRICKSVWNALRTSHLAGGAPSDSEMTSMGVLTDVENRMISMLMVVAFMLEAQRRGRRKIAGGVRCDQRSLLRMYQTLGFQFAGVQSKPDGRDIQLITCSL